MQNKGIVKFIAIVLILAARYLLERSAYLQLP